MEHILIPITLYTITITLYFIITLHSRKQINKHDKVVRIIYLSHNDTSSVIHSRIYSFRTNQNFKVDDIIKTKDNSIRFYIRIIEVIDNDFTYVDEKQKMYSNIQCDLTPIPIPIMPYCNKSRIVTSVWYTSKIYSTNL